MLDFGVQDGDYDVRETIHYDRRKRPICASVFGAGTFFQRDETSFGTQTRSIDDGRETQCRETVPDTHETVSVNVVVRPGRSLFRFVAGVHGQNHSTQSDRGGVHVVSGCGLAIFVFLTCI